MNILSQAEQNVAKRYPELARYDAMHAEVEAMKPAAAVLILTSLGATLSGGDSQSGLLLVAAFAVWLVRWAFIKWRQKQLSDLRFREFERLDGKISENESDSK